jgi:sRNA-binding carbon storage regulator CsrA
MLSLQLKDGEYLTIGEDIVIQVFTTSAIRMSIQAPKELPILRGERRKNAGRASNSTVSSS